MAIPTTYTTALLLLLLTMLCWGSWANTAKLARKWRFELFCYDFAAGAFLCSVLTSFTFGTLGSEITFLDNLTIVGRLQILYAFGAGAVFALANLLLVGALTVAGMAVAFPIGIAAAAVTGVVWMRIARPEGSGGLMFSGAAVLLLAALTASWAYKTLQAKRQADQLPPPGSKKRPPPKKTAVKGVVLSLVSGLFLGSVPQLVQLARIGPIEMGPYPIGFSLAVGLLIMTVFCNFYFLNLPVEGEALSMTAYFRGTARQHLLGMLGGCIWYAGMIASITAAGVAPEVQVGPPLGYAVPQAAAVLAALWGLLAWKEFGEAPDRARIFIWTALALYGIGIALVAVAPLYA